MNFKSSLIFGASLALVLDLGLTALASTTHSPDVPSSPTSVSSSMTTLVVSEDSPLWDCSTMGNHECGPMPTPDSSGLVCWSELTTYDPGVEGICGTPAQAYASHIAYWGLPTQQ